MTDPRTSAILDYLEKHPDSSSNQIQSELGLDISFATVKRILTQLVQNDLLIRTGQGKSTRYRISDSYALLCPVDLDAYFSREIDERDIQPGFNLVLIPKVLPNCSLFNPAESEQLQTLQERFEQNIAGLTENERLQELERLAIDLSWKSSQIEGNTYSLLETERLLKEKETAAGKTREEAVMLLNHKEAIDFIIAHPDYLAPLAISGIEDIHAMLVRELPIDRNIRRRRVGISGTNYSPLDNEFQIRETLMAMCNLINQKSNVFEKALLILLLISYIQPFADGNKRTARIVSNALLMQHGHCPISFRTVDSIAYKKALLLFYEQNNLSAFKKIFMEQYAFAVATYF
jgi:Fic family protein